MIVRLYNLRDLEIKRYQSCISHFQSQTSSSPITTAFFCNPQTFSYIYPSISTNLSLHTWNTLSQSPDTLNLVPTQLYIINPFHSSHIFFTVYHSYLRISLKSSYISAPDVFSTSLVLLSLAQHCH